MKTLTTKIDVVKKSRFNPIAHVRKFPKIAFWYDIM